MRGFLEEMPRLQAAESLRHVTELQIGGGVMKEADAQRILDQWKEESAEPMSEAEMKARKAAAWALVRSTFGVQTVSMFPKG